MSNTQSQTERLTYTINYSQLGTAEPGNPTFEIKTESLALSPGGQVFNRDSPGRSGLRQALRYVDSDYGILAAVRRAGFEGMDDGIQIVSDCAREIGRFNKFRLAGCGKTLSRLRNENRHCD
ncbi:MAG: hypothetical protein LAP38_23470 [Acidobacteriia bacterium]|nr:hypothetical protein [Terriglobia bacterium]